MSPYTASKASAELLVTSYYNTFALPVIILRLNNVYGMHQAPNKILPSFISLLKKNEKIKIRGNGYKVRAFSHVYDVTNAIDLIIMKGSVGETYQIDNTDDECTILDIAKGLILLIVNDKFDKDKDYEPYLEFIEDTELNNKRYFVSNDKLRDLGWIQEIPLVEGLVEMIKWTTDEDVSNHLG